ncbi:akirin-2 isoform X1 [Rhincodon typus]|uniref:akirin-2 isoform X1 n=1 Tax=Rhincodon typus TaxID=259920 RepID=UPI00202E1CBD|nr:akirin-2 isoform X1 [Rhincodon typus]
MACGATLKRTIDFDPLLSPTSQSPKRRRCTPLNSAASPQKYLKMEPSPFREVTPHLTTEQILYNIKQEYKRIQKRRHLESFLHQSEGSCSSDAPSHVPILNGPALQEYHKLLGQVANCSGTSSGSLSPQSKKDQPLFTLRQVGIICERLIKEREEKIREEYEEILDTKLAEQYDTFVKFTHDQIMRRYGEQPASYVS